MFKSASVIIATSFMASSAMALDFNPMIGLQFQAEDDVIGAETGLALGGEVISQSNIIFGLSFSANERDDLIVYTDRKFAQAEVENETLSLWVGKIFDNGFAAKIGYTNYSSEMTVQSSQWGSGSVSGDQNHLLLGGAYHFKNGFNINAHLNIPVSGDTYDNTDLADYTNIQVLAGYRF